VKFRLTGEYGELSPVRNWKSHTGIDFGMAEGTELHSVGNGVISKVFDGSTSIGKGVNIEFPDGTHAIYGHMSKVSVHVGDKVRTGSELGLSGNTGNSTAPHLHFGLKDAHGHFVDPTPMADKVASLQGHIDNHLGIIPSIVSSPEHQGIIGKMIWNSTEGLRDHARDMAIDIALGICDALGDLLVGVTLVGTAVCIIMKVAGWKDGGRWAGILMVSNVLLKYLFGRGA
jgi:hypothetical protein